MRPDLQMREFLFVYLESDTAPGRSVESAKDSNQCRFAGAVRAGYYKPPAFFDHGRDIRKNGSAGKFLGQPVNCQFQAHAVLIIAYRPTSRHSGLVSRASVQSARDIALIPRSPHDNSRKIECRHDLYWCGTGNTPIRDHNATAPSPNP